MKKLTLVPMFLVSFGFAISFIQPLFAIDSNYFVKNSTDHEYLIARKPQKVLMTLGDEVVPYFTHNYCVTKVLFRNLTTGYVTCGVDTNESMFHTVAIGIMKDRYYSRTEIQESI